MSSSSSSCLLLKLSHDETEVIAQVLSDPLLPRLAVNLSSTAKSLRRAMQVPLAELRQQRQDAKQLAVLWGGIYGGTCRSLRAATMVDLGTAINRYINPTSWSTLGNLARCRSLPALHWLSVHGNHCGDEGVRSVRRSAA